MKSFTLLSVICLALFYMSCSDPVVGCMDPDAANFDALAEEDSGNCTYVGCMDPNASNYDARATEDSGNCEYTGCTDPDAANYNEMATIDSGDCRFPGCTDEDGDTYDAKFNEDDGSCTYFNRFLGDYDGNFVCTGAFAGLLDEASSEITRKPGDDNKDEVTVFVSNPATKITLVLDGTITKDDVEINTFIENFEYTLDLGTLVIEGPFEVTVTGTLVRMDDNSLSGDINISIVKPGTGLGTSDICNYVATKI